MGTIDPPSSGTASPTHLPCLTPAPVHGLSDVATSLVDVPLELLAPLKGSVLVRVQVTLRWVSSSDGANGADDDTASMASGSTASHASSAVSAMSQSVISRVEALEQDLTGFAVVGSGPESPSFELHGPTTPSGPTTPDVGSAQQQQRMAFGAGGSPHGSEQCSIPEEEVAQPFAVAAEGAHEEGEEARRGAEPTPLPPWSPPPTVPRALRAHTAPEDYGASVPAPRLSATETSLIVQVAALQLSSAILRTQAAAPPASTTTTADAVVECTVEAVDAAIQAEADAAHAEETKAQVEALQAEAEQLRRALEAENAARGEVTAELAAAVVKHSAELAAAQETHSMALAAAQEKHSAEMAAMQVKHAGELAAKDARIASLEQMSIDAAGLAHTASATAAASASHAEILQRNLDAEIHRREAAEARADSAWKRVISHTGTDDRLRAEIAAAKADLTAARADLAAARADAQQAHDALAARNTAAAAAEASAAADAAAVAAAETAAAAASAVLDAAPAVPAEANAPKEDENPVAAAWGALVHHTGWAVSNTMAIFPKF